MNSFLSCQTNSNEFLYNALDALSNRISSLKSDVTTLQQNEIAPNNLAVYLQNFTVTSDLLQNNWNTVGVIPSNITNHRVWQFSSSFNVTTSSQDFSIVYDFSNVVSNYYATFEGTPSGTINVGNQIFNANEYCTITENGYTLYFNINGLPSTVQIGSQLSYIINFDDATNINISWGTSTTQSATNDTGNAFLTPSGDSSTLNYDISSVDTSTNPISMTITITSWSLSYTGSNPYYIWILDTSWYTSNESYFQGLSSGDTGIVVYFVNSTTTTIAKNALQFKCTNYTSGKTTYELNKGNYLDNNYNLGAGDTTNTSSNSPYYFPYTVST